MLWKLVETDGNRELSHLSLNCKAIIVLVFLPALSMLAQQTVSVFLPIVLGSCLLLLASRAYNIPVSSLFLPLSILSSSLSFEFSGTVIAVGYGTRQAFAYAPVTTDSVSRSI